jgi:hypothetical protein
MMDNHTPASINLTVVETAQQLVDAAVQGKAHIDVRQHMRLAHAAPIPYTIAFGMGYPIPLEATMIQSIRVRAIL